MTLSTLERQVLEWHYERNLVHGSTDLAQFTKLEEEVAELKASIDARTSPVDDIGDILVVLINIAVRNQLSLSDCLSHAYEEIRYRKGKMVDGVFVKERSPRDTVYSLGFKDGQAQLGASQNTSEEYGHLASVYLKGYNDGTKEAA